MTNFQRLFLLSCALTLASWFGVFSSGAFLAEACSISTVICGAAALFFAVQTVGANENPMCLYFCKHLWIVPVCAILNRMRGGGDHDFLHMLGLPGVPFRSLFYVLFLVGAVAAIVFRSWKVGLSFTLCYLLWGVGPWAHWMGLGHTGLPNRPSSWYESGVDYLSFGSVYIALFIRHMNILPGLIIVGHVLGLPRLWMVSPLFAVAVVGAYELGWWATPHSIIALAEFVVGAIWGVLIWAISVRSAGFEQHNLAKAWSG